MKNIQTELDTMLKEQVLPEKEASFAHPWAEKKVNLGPKKEFNVKKAAWAALPTRKTVKAPRKQMPSLLRKSLPVKKTAGGGVIVAKAPEVTYEKREYCQISNLPVHIKDWEKYIKEKVQKFFDKKKSGAKITDMGVNPTGSAAVIAVNSWDAVKKALGGGEGGALKQKVEIALPSKSKWPLYLRKRSRKTGRPEMEKEILEKDQRKIIIMNYNGKDCTSSKIKQTASKFGRVVKFEQAKRGGRNDDAMYIVTYSHPASAAACVNHLHNGVQDGNILNVVASRERK